VRHPVRRRNVEAPTAMASTTQLDVIARSRGSPGSDDVSRDPDHGIHGVGQRQDIGDDL